jgi:alpha-tubulin suppressor-like RCC1 family protein
LDEDGRPHHWGNDNEEFHTPPEDVTFTTIAVGEAHTCGLDVDGKAHCWGREYCNQFDCGQLTAPTDVTFIAITAGFLEACAIRADNRTLMCWDIIEYILDI